MSNKIVFIHGGPRKNGNTRVAASIAVQEAKSKNASVTEIDATTLEFKIPGCAGCMKCHQSDKFGCVLGDQLAQTVSSLTEYDVIVIATPIYWMSYPAQLKMLVDRLGSLMKYTETGEIRTPLAGKTLAVLSTGNSGSENNMDLLEQQWKNVADMVSCRFSACMFPKTSIEAGALKNDPVAAKKAKAFGELLATPH